jgi:hypothetical protein
MIENYLNAGADLSHTNFLAGELFFEKRRARHAAERNPQIQLKLPITARSQFSQHIHTHTKSARAQKHTKFKHRDDYKCAYSLRDNPLSGQSTNAETLYFLPFGLTAADYKIEW